MASWGQSRVYSGATHSPGTDPRMALTFKELSHAPRSQLEGLMKDSKGPALGSIAGYEFRGFNVLYPHEKAVMWILGNVRFIKCFFPEDRTAPLPKDPTELRGYNLKVKNGSVDDPWSTTPNEATPTKIGRYKVYPSRNLPGKNLYPNAVFLDYAQPENNLFSGSTIQDYLVQPDPQNPDLLLGKAFTNLWVMTPATYFILERLQPHTR